jgi:hypothetical protein
VTPTNASASDLDPTTREPNDAFAGAFADDELAALALAADAETPLGADAVPISYVLTLGADSPLPAWYMPAPIRARRLAGWRRHLVRWSAMSVVASFVAITAAGYCNTYGQLHF